MCKVNLSKKILCLTIIIFIQNSIGICFAAPVCGELNNHYGPFDYNDPKVDKKIVEDYHFTPKVENLIGGQNTMTPLGDLDYTLKVFPNHHRALFAVSKYEIRRNQQAQRGGKPYNPYAESGLTVECYFDRAIRWRPKDPNVHLVHGIHLHRIGKMNEALAAYKISERIQPHSSEMQYNLGLLYFEMKQYALAKKHAKIAYQLGYPLPGLQKKLASVGHWP